jgi:hypothetical protein
VRFFYVIPARVPESSREILAFIGMTLVLESDFTKKEVTILPLSGAVAHLQFLNDYAVN